MNPFFIKVKSCLNIRYWKWEEQKRMSLSKMSVAFTFCICLSLQVTNETLISLFVIQVELQNNSCGLLTKKSCRDVIYLFVEDFLSYIHKGASFGCNIPSLLTQFFRVWKNPIGPLLKSTIEAWTKFFVILFWHLKQKSLTSFKLFFKAKHTS